ncbi:thioredoxin family protein [Granulicoccus sp. GXG6511]|uniref:thioredoxin family protein n=1 Tax=Granulicoccus sp. GXG6511 TaxID=3381351 RepID=UPI003D7EA25C
MRIKVLGPGCKNCQNLEKNTKAALKELGLHADIVKVTEYGDIAGYGVMKTPGLVIDEKVVLSGKVASPAEIMKLLKAASA